MHTFLRARFVVLAIIVSVFGVSLAAQQAAAPATQAAAAKPEVGGVRNFTKVDATLACGGALSPEAYDALKQSGFKSIINLRDASEQGANVADEEKAADQAGLKYFHLPFLSAKPDATKVDEFLTIVADTGNQPIMLHCASGARASLFWAVKRVMVDGWPVEKAMGELPDLSKNVSEPLRTFTLDYLKAHGKTRP
jgi:uncharacterized protein (TIGR01244 family)